jgi:uncharacterized protein YkwD
MVALVVGAVAAGAVGLSSAFRNDDNFPTAVESTTTQTRPRTATTTALPTTLPDGSPLAAAPIDPTTGEPTGNAAAAGAADGPGAATPRSSSTQARAAAPRASSSATARRSSTAPPPTTRPPAPPPARAPSSTAPPAPPPSPAPSAASSQQQQVVDLVNVERGKAGCRPLTVDQRLVTAAQLHSEDMSANNYFSHTSLDGRTFDQRIKAAGYPNPAAENIAKGQRSAEQVMSSWMNSSGHRANILNCGLTTIGVGLDTDGWYWTQDFGR